MYTPRALEHLATVLAPDDFLPGSLRVLFSDQVPAAVRGFAGCALAWTSPDADIVCGLANGGRVSTVVLDRVAIAAYAGARAKLEPDAALLGVLVHELAHVAMFPRPIAMPAAPPSVIASVQSDAAQVALRGGGPPQTGGPDDPYHTAPWRRVLDQLVRRCDRMGVVAAGVWPCAVPDDAKLAPSLAAYTAALTDYVYDGSLRALADLPTPPDSFNTVLTR